MIENSHIEKLIMRYLLQEINADELLELENWMKESPENKACFFQLKNISDLSSHTALSEKEIEESWKRMYARMDEEVVEPDLVNPGGKLKKLNVTWIKYAAVLLIAIGLSWSVMMYISNRFTEEKPLVLSSYNEIKVERGGRGNTLVLSDGTKVILNAATSFKYPTNFSDSVRTVYLDGEALFDVARDEQKPFVVRLKNQDINVLGTSFNVEAYSDETYNIVTLLTGSVLLNTCNEDGEITNTTVLEPNQQAITNKTTGTVVLQQINTPFAEAWTKGEYKFKDEPLRAIVRRIEKYYNVKIHLEDEAMEQTEYTGTFSLSQSIEEVLQLIDYKRQFKITRTDKDIYIRNK